MKKIVVFLCCILFSHLYGEEEASSFQLPKILNVGTNAEFAPFSFIADGKVQGFEIDLIQAICKKLDCQCKIRDYPFEALIPELKMGKLHVVAAGMTVTGEREKVVDFSTPYLQDNPLVVVYIEGRVHPCRLEDLNGLKVVVNEGYTADFYVGKTLHLPALRLATPIDAILALKSGRADVFITAANTLKPLAEAEKNVKLCCFPLEGTSDNCALMICKKYPNVREALDHALVQLEQEGVIEELKHKWGLQ